MMKLTLRKVILLIPLIIFVLLVCLIIISTVTVNMKEIRGGEELLTGIIDEARTKYNFTMDKKDYEIEIMYHTARFVRGAPVYGVRKKGIAYRSRYFKELEEMYYEIRANNIMGDDSNFFGYNGGTTMLKIIADFGLQSYVLNTLIYDRSKGNDFEKIEKIFDRYGENIYYRIGANIWDCGGMGKDFEQFYSINYVKNINCARKDKGYEYYNGYKKEVIEEYSKRYDEYFKKPRSLETIDWEGYMRIHEIHPMIKFYCGGLSKEEVEKIQKEIEPYYNKDILDIIIE